MSGAGQFGGGQQTAEYPGWYIPPTRTSGQSVAVFVLGVASLTVFWGIAGIVALCLAPGAKREIAASGGRLEGRGLIRAGVICSWISIVLTILFIAAVVGLFAFAASSSGSVPGEVFTTSVSAQ